MALLSRQKLQTLKKRLNTLEIFDKDLDEREAIKGNTLILAKKAVNTAKAFHRMADIADRYVKDIEAKIETGQNIDPDFLKFLDEFSEELAKA